MPHAERVTLTKRFIDNIPEPKSGRSLFWDKECRGLGVKVEAGTGSKTFFWARSVGGRLRWHTIGATTDYTIEQARARASEINSAVAKWKEGGCVGSLPFSSQRENKITLGFAFERYVESLKAEGNDWEYRQWQFDKYLTHLKDRELAAITVQEIRELHLSLAKHPTTANRIIELVRAIFNHAAAAELYAGSNPAAQPKRRKMKFREQSRERFLQPSELPRFLKCLKESKNQDLQDFLVIALWTGVRRGNILSMRKQNVSLEDNRWTIPKPKNKKPYTVPLVPEVKQVLARRFARLDGSEWVFPSSKSVSGHLVDLKKGWDEFRKKAGIENVTAHDLRRTFGSFQAATGASLSVIGKSLGHVNQASTQIYSRLDLTPVMASAKKAVAEMKRMGARKRLPASTSK